MSMDKFRAPICTIIGHVNVGKTTFLDKLRNTSNSENEPGKITQKIGVTYMSFTAASDMHHEYLNNLLSKAKKKVLIPGLILIDTPGHECFEYQRKTSIQISDIVILIIDITKGIEEQSKRSIKIFLENKIPFIIVLNKIDKISKWKQHEMANISATLKKQHINIKNAFEKRINDIKLECMNNYFNAEIYYKNKDPNPNKDDYYVSLVPVSSQSGEGIPDLLMMINLITTKYMLSKIKIKPNMNTGFILETIQDKKLGEISTFVLKNGHIDINDNILFIDNNNDIIDTKIKRVYVPNRLTELKDKITQFKTIVDQDDYLFGLKCDINNIRVGSPLLVYHTDDEKEKLMIILNELKAKYDNDMNDILLCDDGVDIYASTYGMLMAIYQVFRDKINIRSMNVGIPKKRHIIKISAYKDRKVREHLLEHEKSIAKTYNKRYLVVIGFGIECKKDIIEMMNREHITYINDDIIYKLLEKYKNYVEGINKSIIDKHPELVSLVDLMILKEYIFTKKNPIIIGVKVMKGILKKNIIIKAIKDNKECIIGKIIGIQQDNVDIDDISVNMDVCIKIESDMEYSIDFDDTWTLHTYYDENTQYIIDKYRNILKKIEL